jgi:hypothetical protein
MSRALALLLLLAACKKTTDPPVTDTSDDPVDDFDPVAEGVEAIDADCPESLAQLPEGPTAQLSWDITWADAGEWGAVARPIYVEIPDDVTGLAVAIDAGTTKTALGWATLDGRVLVDGTDTYAYDERVSFPRARGALETADTSWWGTGETGFGSTAETGGGGGVSTAFDGWSYQEPFFHGPGHVGTLVMPMDAGSIPFAGCLALLPAAPAGVAGETATVHLTAKRAPATDDRLDVRIVLAEGSGITPEQAAAAVEAMFEVYGSGDGPTEGTVDYYEIALPGGPYPSLGIDGLGPVRQIAHPDPDPRALTLIFVADFAGDSGTLGIAAGIPGPIGTTGTVGSAVVVSVEAHLDGNGTDLDLATMGETMAHELGHQMGLFHTTESGGDSFDPLDDTPECTQANDRNNDGSLSAGECRDADGTNFMFWTSGNVRQDQVSAEQALVLDHSPVTHGDAP